jgi:putative nucleotidyltransferase with HDIG domain
MANAGAGQDLRILDITSQIVDFAKMTKGFLPIKVRALFPETVLPCDIFSLSHEGSDDAVGIGKLLHREDVYRTDLHNWLTVNEVEELYIRCEDEEAFTDYFILHTQNAIRSKGATPGKKANLLYDQAEYIVKKVFREKPTRNNVILGQQLIAQVSAQAIGDQVTLRALLSLFSKDYYTFSHCIQVAILGMSFCKFIGCKINEVEDFGMGALFHDIGKNSIDEEILNKPGPLDRDEFDIIKRHPLVGYHQIKSTQAMTKLQLEIVLHHHESMDSSGYPDRLTGYDIHKYARVARIIDIYDALTTRRPYKAALTPIEALQVMSNEMKRTLDLHFFEKFIVFIQNEGGCQSGATAN